MAKSTKIWGPAPPELPAAVTREAACLVHIYPTGPLMGTRYPLGEMTLVVGRSQECDLSIADTSVSRHHATLQCSNDGYFVVDLQSTNGTFVNDVRINEPRRLADGDYLRIGNCLYRFLKGGNVESAYHEEIYRLTIIDALTEIHNKRYLLEFLESELARSVRYDRPLALVMIDIDRFKAINDEWGHLCGDFTLRELATCIKRSIRKEDLFARYGGEEFALVLPETSDEGAFDIADRLRGLVEAHPFRYDGRSLSITISLGIAVLTQTTSPSPNELIRLADENLYEAKRQGRNRVCPQPCPTLSNIQDTIKD